MNFPKTYEEYLEECGKEPWRSFKIDGKNIVPMTREEWEKGQTCFSVYLWKIDPNSILEYVRAAIDRKLADRGTGTFRVEVKAPNLLQETQ